jgi:hypothetical protein
VEEAWTAGAGGVVLAALDQIRERRERPVAVLGHGIAPGADPLVRAGRHDRRLVDVREVAVRRGGGRVERGTDLVAL